MKKKGWTKYGTKLRKQIVHEYLTTEAGLRDLEKKYGVNYSTIHYWVQAEKGREQNAGVSGETKS